MRVFSKVTFALGKPNDLFHPLVVLRNGCIQDIPDWAQKDSTFMAGMRDGAIEIIQNREQELRAQLNAAGAGKPAKSKTAPEKAASAKDHA